MSDAPRLKVTDVRVIPLRTIREVGALEPAWNPGGSMRFAEGGGSCVEVQRIRGWSESAPAWTPNLLPAVRA